MKTYTNINRYLTYKDIFKAEPKSILEYFYGVDRLMLLKVGQYLISISNSNSPYSNNRTVITNFFGRKNNAFANKIYKKILKIEKNENHTLSIVSPLGSHFFFEEAYNFSQLYKEKKTDDDSEIDLFKALLVINQRVSDYDAKMMSSIKNEREDRRLGAMLLTMTIPAYDITNYDHRKVFVNQFVKAIYLLEFLSAEQLLKPMYNKLLHEFNCEDWKDYIKRLVPYASPIIKHQNKGHTNIIFSGHDYHEQFHFIDNLTIDSSTLGDNYDFVKLRSKPFFIVDEKTIGIISPLFALEMIYKGLFFRLWEYAKKLKIKGINNFRSYYCDNFSEEYLFNSIMERLSQKYPIKYSGAELRKLGCKGEPDFYIRKGNEIYLFESKDLLLNAQTKLSFDYREYKKYLFERFNFRDDRDKNGKAIQQLLKNILKIVRRKNIFDNKYELEDLTVYPIIITHDHIFNSLGINYYINTFFNIEIKNYELRFRNITVKPIILIDIDTLIYYHRNFEEDFVFGDIISKYISSINSAKDEIRQNESQSEFKNRSLKQFYPFSVFLDEYIRVNSMFKPPAIIEEKGLALFKDEEFYN